ncbi:hypothetical protein [Pontimicrobium aquaticum]|uniref:Lipoprotein n=1 Tax=Pontimicrobium aquaticum TaxID=2565367 RepID=A0A4V5LR22_9FLAO|nr:hypothetical protein [Pontimicrobium aquaticum]TJY37399.1 hypothetical protein E5167_05505 [Pontimicrobium aquaticum]
MKVFYKIVLSSLLLLLFGCKPITISQNPQNRSSQSIDLGSIGIDKNTILNKSFIYKGFPIYDEPLRLSVTFIDFTKHTYKKFRASKTVQASKLKVNYVDSLEVKPKYFSFRISDVVGLIKTLNSDNNINTKDMLEVNSNLGVVTNVLIAYSEEITKKINDANAVFLVQNGFNQYGFQLNTNETQEVIPINQGVVFDYKLSKCCWQESSKHELIIADLVDEGAKCPYKTFKSPKYIKEEEKDYLKF